MITVHHLNNSRSQRVLWLLEELEIPYKIQKYERDAKTMLAPPSLRAVHPLGKSPVISDGDTVVAESGAIVEYLVERHGHGRLMPARGTPEHLRYVYWLHYAEGSAMLPLLLKLIFARIGTAPAPFIVRPIIKALVAKVSRTFIDPQLQLHLDYMERELTRHEWFAGKDFSAADVQMSFPLEAAAARGGLDQKYPKLVGFLARIHARPAYQRALEKGGHYALLTGG
jgi:glutathione S-transferase